MKKQILRFLSAFIPAATFFVNVQAQVAKSGLELNLKEIIFNEAMANQGIISDHNKTEIIARAERDFSKRFSYENQATWYTLKDGYTAVFQIDGVLTKIYYDRHGRWDATISSYSVDKLPRDIWKMVKSTYYDNDIYLVTEVTVGFHAAYLVSMEDGKTYKTVRIVDGEMDVYEEYIKI